MNRDELTGRRRPATDNLGAALRDAFLLDLEVVATEDLSAHVRRVTVSSPDLVGFRFQPGQDLTLEFPGERSVRRRYTIRRADPHAGTAELEFELHGGDGVAARWAADAALRSRLDAVGPRGKITVQPEAARHVFVADDSAMPAAFAMLEALPFGETAVALLVTPNGPNSRPGPAAAIGQSLTWIEEGALADAIAVLGVVPNAAVYVIGERQMVLRATDEFEAAGVPRAAIASKPYWRRDQPNAAHGEPARD